MLRLHRQNLRRSLATRQAVITIVLAVALGVVSSLILTTRDFLRTRDQISTTAEQILRSAQNSATQASWTLDRLLARQILNDLQQTPIITQASITSEKNIVLAQYDRREQQPAQALDLLFEREMRFSRDLAHVDAVSEYSLDVGKISITINGVLAGREFLDRAGAEIVFGLVRNILLALLILLISRKIITRPLEQVTDNLLQAHRSKQLNAHLQTPEGHEENEIGAIVHTTNELLRQLEQHTIELDHIFEAIPDAIIYKDAQGRWIACNKAAQRLFALRDFDWYGKTDSQMAQERTPFALLHEQEISEDEATWKSAQLMCFEKSRSSEDNARTQHFDVRKIPIFTKQKERRNLLVISRDVTDLRRAETDLRIAAKVFESVVGVIVTDKRGTILRTNHAFTEITGYSSEEAIGHTPALLKSGKHDAEFYRRMWAAVKKEGRWQGEVWNRRKNGEIYPEWLIITSVLDENDAGEPSHYIGTLMDLSSRKRAEEEIAKLAFYDQLTQLPNRRLMMDRLEHATIASQRHRRTCALMLLDLDNFKLLNDSFGHAIGDKLLQKVAGRLKSCVRAADTIARLGGDEFIILLEDLDSYENAAIRARSVAQNILDELRKPYLLETGDDSPKRSYQCTSSVGIVLFNDSSQNIDDLLKHADTAMYQAKSQGRNMLCFFDPEMQRSIKERAALERDLRNAIILNQFCLYYQPQVNADGEVIGAEALIRWHHPQRGLVSPMEFIPLAEETGLILTIGQWVLETACKQLANWSQNSKTDNLSLAINVSAIQFDHERFNEHVLHAIRTSNARPELLKLELTESLLLKNTEEIIEKMRILKTSQVDFSLDDFGTGYSSLSYLKRLPISQLKIDSSFVRDILTDANDAAIAHTVVALGKTLGLSVIAEGVESAEQKQALINIGCQNYQGYYFSRPLPLNEFEQYIESGAASSSVH